MSAGRRAEGQGAPLVPKPPKPRARPPEGREAALGLGPGPTLPPAGGLRPALTCPQRWKAGARARPGCHGTKRDYKAGVQEDSSFVSFPFLPVNGRGARRGLDQPITRPVQGRTARGDTRWCARFWTRRQLGVGTRLGVAGPSAAAVCMAAVLSATGTTGLATAGPVPTQPHSGFSVRVFLRVFLRVYACVRARACI